MASSLSTAASRCNPVACQRDGLWRVLCDQATRGDVATPMPRRSGRRPRACTRGSPPRRALPIRCARQELARLRPGAGNAPRRGASGTSRTRLPLGASRPRWLTAAPRAAGRRARSAPGVVPCVRAAARLGGRTGRWGYRSGPAGSGRCSCHPVPRMSAGFLIVSPLLSGEYGRVQRDYASQRLYFSFETISAVGRFAGGCRARWG